jgi:hypothetical protein
MGEGAVALPGSLLHTSSSLSVVTPSTSVQNVSEKDREKALYPQRVILTSQSPVSSIRVCIC